MRACEDLAGAGSIYIWCWSSFLLKKYQFLLVGAAEWCLSLWWITCHLPQRYELWREGNFFSTPGFLSIYIYCTISRRHLVHRARLLSRGDEKREKKSVRTIESSFLRSPELIGEGKKGSAPRALRIYVLRNVPSIPPGLNVMYKSRFD